MSQPFLRPFFVLFLLVGNLVPVDAAPPPNDNHPGGYAIIVLPEVTVTDISEATLQPEEPQHCAPTDRTVWYGFVPDGPITMTADTLDGGGTTVSIYREAGSSGTFADLEFMQCTNGGGVTLALEPGERYFIQVGAVVGEDGIVDFSLSDLIEISGRVVDALTGAPLPGYEPPYVWVTLLKACGEGCLEEVAALPTDEEGRFRFENYSFGGIEPGSYKIRVSADLYPDKIFGPFEFAGGNLDLGDLEMDFLPTIHSIRGRVLDRATGKPIPRTFSPVVNLYRCTELDCYELMNSQVTAGDGRFRFDTDSFGNPLPVGRYVVFAGAAWYEWVNREVDLSEGERLSLGTLRIRSAPIRFSDVRACPDLPSTGGECLYSARVWNGLASTFEGAVWGTARAFLYDTALGFTNFQIKDPQKLLLEPGQSKVVRFRLEIPEGKSPSEIGLCVRIYVGRGGNPYFNTIATESPFCTLDLAGGPGAAAPGDAGSQGQAGTGLSPSGTEIEPNNSCETAQDLSALPLPITLEESLTPAPVPDIDFFRFRGEPGAPITIDFEGQPTGKGTLQEPLLGLFDSSCYLIQILDGSSHSRLVTSFPKDGVLILAASAVPDWGFVGWGDGTYRLHIAPIQAIGSIRGTVRDAVSGAPVSGEAPGYASVYLIRCDALSCIDVAGTAVGSDGSFSFERDFNGLPLSVGTYMVVASASQYQYALSEEFVVDEGESVDIGDILLTPWAVQISEIQNCSLPTGGGACEMSLKVTNTLSTRFSGKAWDMVYADYIGTPLGFTAFRAGEVVNLRLGPGESRTLRFRFRLRSAVPVGAIFCSEILVGQNPNAFFTPVGAAWPFCIEKGAQGLSVMPAQDAQAALRQMQMRKLQPNQSFPQKQR